MAARAILWTLLSNASIPDPPSKLCGVDNVQEKEWDFSYDSENYRWAQEFDNYYLSVVDNTWIEYADDYIDDPTLSNAVSICLKLPAEYTPLRTKPGNPVDCERWSLSNDTYFTEELSLCSFFETDIQGWDIIWLFYAFGVVLVLCLFMCPCCILNKKCKRDEYPATHLEIYEKILQQKGIDPSTPRANNDKRPLGLIILKNDLFMRKVVWHNNYFKDYLTHLRFNHTFLALFYGHPQHPYNRKERLFAFISIQFLAFGASAWLTYTFGASEYTTADAMFLDWIIGLIISAAQLVFRFLAICSCFEHTGKCERRVGKHIGHCGMLAGAIYCILFGTTLAINHLVVKMQDEYPHVDMEAVIAVAIVNYISGLFVAWFLIDIIFMTLFFHNEWHMQKGEYTCCVKIQNRMCCCCSYMCCWCICYHMCIKKNKCGKLVNMLTTEKEDYVADAKTKQIIGSRWGEFGVTWQDYQHFVNGEPCDQRDMEDFAKSIRTNTERLLSLRSISDPSTDGTAAL